MRRLIHTIYLILFAGLLCTSGLFIYDAQAEYRKRKEDEARVDRRLAELQAKLVEQQRILERLRNDPAYVERVIRRQLKYARPDELVFRLDE